jgi:hypothetical protein
MAQAISEAIGYLLRTLHNTPVPDGVRVLAKP